MGGEEEEESKLGRQHGGVVIAVAVAVDLGQEDAEVAVIARITE